ncbi:Transcriptional regulatory protein MucR [Brevundimonas sp. Bb-A]|nr:Transcriptional regulatory protein MucR [Brevundimonas sp. Bb-A]
MTEPNILAFQNAELLAALEDSPTEGWTRSTLAARLDRDPSNTMRALKALAEANLVHAEPMTDGLTDAGREQLAAYRRAQHGAEKRRARGQWPIDKFRPNPLNRPVRREVLADMAASMRGPAGLVQRVIATEPDANGVRMLIDGEHRWAAAKLLLNQAFEEGADLPDWLADGLPFEEGRADPATALVITLVANARRADMSPWEDAQQLLKLQQATDWSAAELARQIGRVKEGETSGLRDVQQKLKIAREATPQAIADYERTGSWDSLRASVTTPKAPTLSDQIADHGPAVLQPQSSSSWIHVQTHSAPVHKIPAVRDASLALFKQDGGEGETRYRAHFRAERMDCRLYVTQPTVAGTPSLAYQAAIEDMLRREWPEAPQTLIEWADRIAGPFVVAGKDHLNASRAKEARYALGWDKRQANSGGGSRTTEDAEDDAPYVRPHNRTPVPPLTAASAPVTSAPAPAPAPANLMSAHLKGLADEAADQRRQGLRAALEVLIERLEPVLTALHADDGDVAITADDADYFHDQLTEAVRWGEDALAAAGAFDPLPGEEIARPDIGSPAVPIRQSIHPDYVVCLEDGRKFKSLKRHLRTRYNLSPDEYRARWGLPADYPMVAPNYAKAREDLARQMGVSLRGRQ